MNFKDVSRVFDSVGMHDGYTGRFLFYGQPASFETSNPEGSVSKRRVLSLASNIVIPARRCLRFIGERWIVGDGSADGLFDTALRTSFWVKKVTDEFTYRTPGEAALGAGGTTAYAQREYLRDTTNGGTDAEYDPQYEVFFASGETPVKNGYLVSDTTILRVRAVRPALAGFLMVSSDEIGLPARVTATFDTGAYDPATDSYAAGSAAVPTLLYDRSKEYILRTEADPKNLAGDRTMIVAKTSITPVVGQQLAADGATWQVLTVTSNQDAWSLHLKVV